MLELYKNLIAEQSRATFQVGKPAQYFYEKRGWNRLCGDDLWIYATGSKQALELWYDCRGCALCKASCAVLVSSQNLKSEDEIHRQCLNFLAFDAFADEPLKTLATAKNYPARLKCITLPWQTLSACLLSNSKEELYVTTE